MSSNEISNLGNYSAGAGSDSKKSVESHEDPTAPFITKKLSSKTVSVSQSNSSTLSNSDRWNPKDFEPISFASDGDQLTIFPLESEPPEPDDYQSIEEYEEAWQSWERSQIESQSQEVTPSVKSTYAVELAQDSPSQAQDLVQTSLDTEKSTNSVLESFPNDSPLPEISETLKRRQQFWRSLTGQTSVNETNHYSSPPHPPASHSALEESDSVQKTNGTVSHQSLSLSEEFNLIIFSWKTSQDCLLADTSNQQTCITQSLSDGRLIKSGTACKQYRLEAEIFPVHLNGSASYWLPSPTALSSINSRPPGLNKLENFLRQQGWLTNQEVINPSFLEQEFAIPTDWSNPNNHLQAWEFLKERQVSDNGDKPLEIVLTPESQKSELTEFSSLNRSEPSNGQRGCLYPYIQNKRLKDGTIKSYPKVEGERNPDNDKHWRWAYCWHDVSNGYKKRSISIPYSFLNAVRSLISSGIGEKNIVESDRIPQRILQLIRCAK